MISLFSMTAEEYSSQIKVKLGKGSEYAKAFYSSWFRQASIPYNLALNGARLEREIFQHTDLEIDPIGKIIDSGSTIKFTVTLKDNYETESVIIPMQFGWSLCVSSQIGCRMGCKFCQTGQMGLIRQLEVREIVQQLFIAKHFLGYNIKNIVFMGMGEPFDNLAAVKAAVDVFTDPYGFGLAKRHITLSTSGKVEGIYEMIHLFDPAVNLAISVNAPNDQVRTSIMPVNRKHNMASLMTAMKAYTAHPRRSLLIEYVLLEGITDSLENAKELADYLEELKDKVRVNLIPYNPQSVDRYKRPTEDTLDVFLNYLRNRGYRTLLRKTKGTGIMAACGQLGNQNVRLTRIGAQAN